MEPAGRRDIPGEGILVRFDDMVNDSSLMFSRPVALLTTRDPNDVRSILVECQHAVAEGMWVAGFVAYEAAPAFDPAFSVVHPAADRVEPLVWFGVFDGPTFGSALSGLPSEMRYACQEWTLGVDLDRYRANVGLIRERIASGDTYQCNYTERLVSVVDGDLRGLYHDLALRQGGTANAYIETDNFAIISASPETFFDLKDDTLICRPMKGTAKRGPSAEFDRRQLELLSSSAKDRAENVMIVDLIRNDLSRLARLGTVVVRGLCDVERFQTVWQLTSTVEATIREGVGFVDIMEALYPCGSITGAPKASTMRIISSIEDSPRGVYCGSIGWLAPPDQTHRASFNVAIRTAVVDKRTGSAIYGAGGGITWSSDPDAEYEELLSKAAILSDSAPTAGFVLIETMRVSADGVRNGARHFSRLKTSAEYFGFVFPEEEIKAIMFGSQTLSPMRLRLTLAMDGRVEKTLGALTKSTVPVHLCVDTVMSDMDSVWTYHKTSVRRRYELARSRHPDADDVVLINKFGRVTECTVANLVFRSSGTWWTPPVSDGCLPGTERQRLLEVGLVQVRSATADDLFDAEGLGVVSSLRGFRRAVMIRRGSDRSQP